MNSEVIWLNVFVDVAGTMNLLQTINHLIQYFLKSNFPSDIRVIEVLLYRKFSILTFYDRVITKVAFSINLWDGLYASFYQNFVVVYFCK
jgi:hypothetical protein